MSQHPCGAFAAVDQYMTEHDIDFDSPSDGFGQFSGASEDYNNAAIDALLQPPTNPHDGVLPLASRAQPYNSYSMRHQQPKDLDVLCAETHHDSQVVGQQLHKTGNSNDTSFALLNSNGGQGFEFSPVPTEQKGSQSKSMRSSADTDEEQPTKQKGRPRLEKRDATAADRRRTQIRLAQRAYRLRKETTISSLTAKVSQLTSTIDEMNKSCSKLNDDAISSGIMQLSPKLALELQQTTEHLSLLARNATSDSDHDQEQAQAQDADAGCGPSKSAEQDESRLSQRSQPSRQVSAVQERLQPRQMLGYQNTYSSIEDAIPSVEDSDLGSRYAQITPSPVPKALTPTYTYSAQETTFARRLMRAAIERAYRLILDNRAPASAISRVFGYCLAYSTRDQTLGRFREVLSRSSKEPLEQVFAPFVSVGGAGTHYPRSVEERGSATKNPRGPQAVIMNKLGEPSKTREPWLNSIGFGGEWFDSNDVESYLRQRGVQLEAQSSFAQVEVPVVAHQLGGPSTSSTITDNDMPDIIPVAANADNNLSTQPRTSNSLGQMFPNAPITDPYGFTNREATGTSIPHMLNLPHAARAKPRTNVLTLDVSILIDELIKKAVCLGKTPGYRRDSVDSAIQVAIQAF
ncbi:MAG: hypothetical protein M1812_006355 [Candelaria pacifica]|nr:MAG: hypothetical protein M1812_006355 [Candelaria pacifica]